MLNFMRRSYDAGRRRASLLGKRAQLVVGDETALLGADGFYRRDEDRPLRLGDVEAEPLDCKPDRVDAALLAEHDRALGGDQLGRVRLASPGGAGTAPPPPRRA